MITMLLHIALVSPGASAGGAEYARPEMLVEAKQLADPGFAKQFRILDARTKEKYDAGHVPGAVWIDHDAWSKAFAAKQDAAEWSKRIGALGVASDSKVLIYDDAKGLNAARMWWLLRYWGARDVRLLNGGWTAWTKAESPVSKEASLPKPAAFAIAAPEQGRFADKSKVLDILKDKKTQIIDTRSEGEFCGEGKLKAKKGGHIPGALHLEWSEAIDPKTHKFKNAGELTRVLKDAGIDVTRPSVTHCQSGGRASVMAFTLELMGAKDVANYYRGWSEWGNAPDTPIVKSPKK